MASFILLGVVAVLFVLLSVSLLVRNTQRSISYGIEGYDLELSLVSAGSSRQHFDGRSESQTVNPRDVWEPTDLERSALPVAGMLLRQVILQQAQQCMTAWTASSTHHETEVNFLESSAEAAAQDAAIASQTSVVEKHALAEILPTHAETPKDSRTFSTTSPDSQTTIPKIACTVAGCTHIFNKQYELNHHMRYHNKQKICETCQASFGIVTHLERHINSVHKTAKVYHCTVAGCSYFKTANPSKSFSRKDNWRRHMIEQHGSGQGDDLGVMDFENHVIDS